jgi:hypothetical protein
MMRGGAITLATVLAVAAAAPLALADPAPAPPAAQGKKSFTESLSCNTCHTTATWKSAAAGGDGKFDHSKTGFPLHGQHSAVSCTQCHDGKRQLKRECASCHDDYHRGRLSRACDGCHAPAGWKVTKPIEMHRLTRFPLTGMHVLADCSQCHVRASEHRFTNTPVQCFACHEKDYRRPDLRPLHTGDATTAPFSRDCSTCHRAVSFVPAFVPPGQGASPLRVLPPTHDRRFPVSFGVHRIATCEDCHTSTAIPRAVRCTGCHAHDPARLSAQHKANPTSLGDGPACLACHPGGARR